MRFRKGSRVEVFSIKEAPYGAWRSAEIISGNGHTYSVRYYSFELSNNEAVEERVPRKIIRPCPPQVDVDRWEAGELVEVLDNISWKTATVLEELSGRYYVVRLLGSKAELTVHKVNLRARQSWQDEKWVMIGKVSCSVKSSTLTGSDEQQNLKPLLNSVVPQETGVASLRVLKRPSPCDSAESAESCTRSPKKIRSLEEEGHQHRFASSELRGVKMHVQASFNKNKSGFRQLVRVRSKRFSECVGTGSSVSNGCYDTDACSVGSCSPISYDESDIPTSFLDGASQGADSCSSDAESSKEAFGCREEATRKHSLSGNGAVGGSCRPELYTYRSTLRKLFASGPLSWDQEASLTDLRLSFKIANDEHLMELRNLKSAGTHN
ncbi:ENT domain [Arabidopsis thaliana x Arabidopsis arenosa]|uniref:ENT domain n=1 Tax=Arabidopsis thaliana x Arabidopsis arenosa TaxID=1240361 RepID=A0A8T2A2I4_9BRAS|nr:ENT domain [Arabidopsis thaliana x Arabidopsis arenosa]